MRFTLVDGNYCLTCGSDKKIKLWNPGSALYLNTYAGHGNEVLDAASSCDNRYIQHLLYGSRIPMMLIIMCVISVTSFPADLIRLSFCGTSSKLSP